MPFKQQHEDSSNHALRIGAKSSHKGKGSNGELHRDLERVCLMELVLSCVEQEGVSLWKKVGRKRGYGSIKGRRKRMF